MYNICMDIKYKQSNRNTNFNMNSDKSVLQKGHSLAASNHKTYPSTRIPK